MESKQFIIAILLLVTLWSCEGKLGVEKLDNVAQPGFPEYNFSFRFLSADSSVVKNDTITKEKMTFVELYVNQLDFLKGNASYTFDLTLPENIDASLIYKGVEYRVGDRISIPYAHFKNKVILVSYLPITSGTYTMTLKAKDQGNNEQSFAKKLTVK
jgi:hypothetical protein